MRNVWPVTAKVEEAGAEQCLSPLVTYIITATLPLTHGGERSWQEPECDKCNCAHALTVTHGIIADDKRLVCNLLVERIVILRSKAAGLQYCQQSTHVSYTMDVSWREVEPFAIGSLLSSQGKSSGSPSRSRSSP
jgi:hypothetical protein